MLLTGVATSQSVIRNTQSQSSPVATSQPLSVDNVSGTTTAVTDSTANGFSGAVTSGTLNVVSSQSLTADVTARTTLDVVTSSGTATTLNTAATGNTTDVDTVTGGGAVKGSLTQSVGAVNITAVDSLRASGAQTGSFSSGTQAIANSQGYGSDASPIAMTTKQTSAATTEAADGGTLMYTPGTASFSASAIANNVSGTGTGGANQTLRATQTSTGARTQGAVFAYFGNAQTPQAASTAVDNNITLNNDGGTLNVVDSQTNSSYTRAQTELSSYEFGAAQASAYGVGNSVLAANVGPSTTVNNSQTNSGGIQVLSDVTGNTGYDASSSATAMGNAVTGFACSDCGGAINVSNTQINTGGVSATNSIEIAGSNRSVTGTATAVGNTATFYVSKPKS